MFNDWLELLKKLSLNNYSSENFICPECGQKNVEYIFVGDSTTNIGYLPIWCRNCNKGIQISRVEIPKEVNMIEFGDLESIKNRIPNFKHIIPKISENTNSRLFINDELTKLKMSETLELVYVLEHINEFNWSDALFLPEDEVWNLNTKCMVLDPDDVEDDEEDAPQIAKEKGLIYTLSIQNVQMIYENVHEQKEDCSNDDLIKAFLYYYDNDAYIEF